MPIHQKIIIIFLSYTSAIGYSYEILCNEIYEIPAGSYYTIPLPVNRNDKILGSVFCYDGGNKDIDVYLLDMPNRDRYVNDEPFYYILRGKRKRFYTIDYTVPFNVPCISAEEKEIGGIVDVDACLYIVLSNLFSVVTDKSVYVFIIRTRDTKKEIPKYISPHSGYDH